MSIIQINKTKHNGWFLKCLCCSVLDDGNFLFSTNLATVRKINQDSLMQLKDFGCYVSECLPKYVQKVQISAGDELEVLVSPDGILPTLSFLKDHHNAQFGTLADITAIDVPSRPFRFEVCPLC